MIDPPLEQDDPVPGEPPTPTSGLEPAEIPLSDEIVLAQVMYACWRCGQTYVAAFQCPFCKAEAPPNSLHRAASAQVDADSSRVIRMVWFLVAFLATSILMAIVSSVHDSSATDSGDDPSWEIGLTAVVEGMDTVLVLVGLLAISLPPAPRVSVSRRLQAWPLFLLLLGLCLLLNFGYFHFLHEIIRLPEDWDLGETDWPWGWSLALIVVQPAIVEELFFRRLLLGTLRTVMGTHAAVWITAAAFGLAHLYNPLGVPYLIVLGALFGYARTASGGLALPMVMHALHNLVVTFESSWAEGF